MIGPLLERAPLADPGSLSGRLVAGDGPVDVPLVSSSSEPARRPGRLPISAFGTTSPELRDRLERVLAGEGFVVTTGQQPVLFLGPLYVIYKALSAIELASRLEDRSGVPVVPVFWIASDDHDWEEIGQTTLLDNEGELHTLRIAPTDDHAGRSAGGAPLGEDVVAALAEASQVLPSSEFTPDYIRLLETSYSPGTSVSDAFAAALGGVLDGHEFAWLDSGHPELKRASAPFFSSMFDADEDVLASITKGESSLRDAGFEPPIAHLDGGLPLFFDDGDRRQRVVRSGDDGEPAAYAAGREGRAEPLETWTARLESESHRFSPNVTSRPVLESWLMPVAATVLGPGEIAYWSQLPPVFDHFEVPFPHVLPRASILTIEARVEKTLARLDIGPEDLADGGDAVAARLTADSRPELVDEAIRALRAAIGGASADVQSAIGEELPGLRSAAGKTTKAMQDAVTDLNRLVDAAVREQEEAALARVHKAAAALWPARKPQERVLSPFQFLSRYGETFVRSVRASVAEQVSDFLAGSTGEG